VPVLARHLEIRHVILSEAKDLVSLPRRSFASLRMTCLTPLKPAHGKPSLQMSTFWRERKALRDMKQDREFFKDEVPLACTLIGSEQVTRREEVGELFKDVLKVNELADGYALCFPGSDGWANKLVQFITFERGCCPFFTFELAFEPEQGPIWLHLRGPEGVKAMIENMMYS
jgi:hypothetical protein